MKTVLITGVSGFLGRYVAKQFHNSGWRVIGMDAGAEENAPSHHLMAFISSCLPDRLCEVLQEESPHVVVHCAGRASVGISFEDPLADFHGNSVLTYSILDSIRLHAPACRFVNLSSAAVYGNPSALPVTEDTAIAPISPYGFHKLQTEFVCKEFATAFGIRTCSLRIFSAYGAGLRRQVLWDLANKICAAGPFVLQGTGEESRDFIHAGDIASAVLVVADSAPMLGECYNLASGSELRIADLAMALLRGLKSSKQISFDGNLPAGTPTRWQADIGKICTLGFKPKWEIEKGISDYVRWAEPLLQQ